MLHTWLIMVNDLNTDVIAALVGQWEEKPNVANYSGAYPYLLGRVSALLTDDQWKEVKSWLRDDNGLQEE